MGFYTVLSAAVQGLGVEMVQVEADASNGLPVFHMVGYLSSEVKEAAERVRTARRNTGYMLPAKKIVVNLSPACVKKRGTAFDLPIAVAVLGALGIITGNVCGDTLFIGELGLDGKLQGVGGVLPVVLEAKEQGMRCCVLPFENVREARLVEGIRIIGAKSLEEVCEWLNRGCPSAEETGEKEESAVHAAAGCSIDYSDILGQESVKRATLVAVAGNHNLLYIGPPGAGKTMMAKRIPTILPPLTRRESLEITRIYSAAGLVKNDSPLIEERPFREVHHTVTRAALAGGGRVPAPGEVTLAHGGVLEVLRQPLEEKCVHLARQQGAYLFPADFMLVAAMNPCPCGYYPDLARCTCTVPQIQKYLGKISQPFLDRIDICVDAPKVEYRDLTGTGKVSSSEEMRGMVVEARRRQQERFGGTGISANAQMGREQIDTYCHLSREGERMMRQAYEVMNLTARSFHKILKVARTIADLDQEEQIREIHVQEAIGYRMIDKKYWGC